MAHGIDVDEANFETVVVEGSRHAPVVIDFWAPWCAPCRTLKPVLEKLAAEYDGKFTLAKINSDENPQLAASMGVRGIPAVKAVVDGNIVDEFVGAQPESQVRDFIERLVPSRAAQLQRAAAELLHAGRHADALPLLDEALALEPRHEGALVDKLEALVELGRHDEAKPLLATLESLGIDDARVASLRARAAFAAGRETDVPALEATLRAQPADLDARLELARAYVRAGRYEAALDELLEIVRRDRKFGDDAGRRTMLEIFDLLGPQHELVSRYRRALSSALY